MNRVTRLGFGMFVLAMCVGQVCFAQDKKKKKPAGDAPSADGMIEYRSAKHGFRIKYPSGWSSAEGKDPVVTFSNRNANGQVTENVIVSMERSKNIKRTEDNLDVIMAEVEVQFRKQFTDVKIISEKPVEVAGFPGREIVFTGVKNGTTVELDTAFTVARGQFYMVTGVTTPDRYASAASSIHASIASFELMQPKKK